MGSLESGATLGAGPDPGAMSTDRPPSRQGAEQRCGDSLPAIRENWSLRAGLSQEGRLHRGASPQGQREAQRP